MRITLLYLFIFISNFYLAQTQSKPINYYNYELENIPKTEFDRAIRVKNYRYNRYDLDDQVANILYQNKTTGKLESEEFSQLKNYLGKIEPLKNDILIIIYYPGKDRCNRGQSSSTWNIFDNDFIRKVNKISTTHVFWIYKNDEDLKYYYPKKINWQKDENKLIENLFFKMHYPCFSSATIDRDGNFISNLGEFGKQSVIDDVRESTIKK